MVRDSIYEIDGGKLRYHMHPGQLRAWDAPGRWVVVLAGTQGGKTTMGPPWMRREMQRRGPGDYMVVTPTFPLLDKKALPEFCRLFEDILGMGRYIGSPSRRFELSPAGQRQLWGDEGDAYKTTVWFGYATDPDSLEAMTCQAAWLDEVGQPAFKLGSWEAIQRRLSINTGRALFTTTPYYFGWLKTRFWDRRDSPEVSLINFKSVENPAFPRDEYERARRELPPWKFEMFYNGLFTRPAGLIYDVFSRDRHVIAPFAIPHDWPRYMGLDFGGVHTAAVYLAERSSGHYVLYREYLDGGKTAAGHVAALRELGATGEMQAYGGSSSEKQWRDEFSAAGLHVYAPRVTDVEVGIDRVYQLLATDRLQVFESCADTIDQLESYSRPTDEEGRVLEGIENKETYHYLDALRYAGSHLGAGAVVAGVSNVKRNLSRPRQRVNGRH